MKLSIAHMRAAGLTAEQILKVIEEADAERRTRERIKKQNQRARPPCPRDTRDGGDNRDRHIYKSSTSFLSSEKEEKEEKKERKISIPVNWKPTDADREYAKGKGWSDQQVDQEAERFHNHYLANGEPRKSWPASWRKWVTSPYQKSSTRAGSGGAPPRPGSREDRAERTHHALQKLRDFVNQRLR